MISIHPISENLAGSEGIKLRCCLIAAEFGITGIDSGKEGVYVLSRESTYCVFIPVNNVSSITAFWQLLADEQKLNTAVCERSLLAKALCAGKRGKADDSDRCGIAPLAA